jgi:hypothetical protein
METENDKKRKVPPLGTHSNLHLRELHNVRVVRERLDFTDADVEKAIADARAGIVYDSA